MTERDRVIKGLESLHERLLDAARWDSVAMLDALMVAGAIYLLKEQPETEWCEKCGRVRLKSSRISYRR